MGTKLQTRQIQADPIKGIHTLQSTFGIELNKKHWKVGDLNFFDDAEQEKGKEINYKATASPFLFVCAIEVMLRTLAKAGLYWVTDPEDDRPWEEKDRHHQSRG